MTVNEYETPYAGGEPLNLTRTATTSYAYWDASKYYQQKAVKDPGGRMSFTDYYTSSDSNLGNRGQTYQVWDAKYGGVALNTSITPPTGTLAQDAWRYQVQPTTGEYSAQLTYDSKGRQTMAYKLQAATAGTASTYRYVTMQTTYGADGDGSWGQASQVVEDSGGINRTTRNLGYTSWGKADDVVDAAGHEIQTAYDGDNKILSVTQVGVGTIASYAYGGSGLTNGQVVSVADNLSGVTQTFTYQIASGGGLGQVASVTETRSGTVDNVSTYTYDGYGNRATATYRDRLGNILTQWGYYDYICVGSPAKPAFVFQTFCKLDGSGNRTSEEFHYAYDSVGHITDCAFAQTPSNSSPDSNGYYDGHLAATRARAHYEYDAGGRVTWLAHYWDTLNSGGTAYTSEAILAQGADYEVNTGLNRGLKLDSKYYTRTTPGQANWTLAQTDSYSYDPQLDYLTGASYGDGQANATPTWSYDAAGNRNDAVTDNLNRATLLGGVSTTSDILGNRLTMGSKTYSWDALSRMTSYSNGTTSTSYIYRGDGMRIYKSNSNGATSYRYDGQMGVEDVDYLAGQVQKVTDYGVGARGIDGIYITQSGNTGAAYPIYDSHGNMISTLARSGSGGYTFSTPRTYDAWGNIRLGVSTGDPKGRYCASLGHKQDDETSFVYMRARYYEPTSGRFANSDPMMKEYNSFAYASNNPVGYSDSTGALTEQGYLGIGTELMGFNLAVMAMILAAGNFKEAGLVAFLAVACLCGGPGFITFVKGQDALNSGLSFAGGAAMAYLMKTMSARLTGMLTLEAGSIAYSDACGVAARAVVECAVYAILLIGFIAAIDQ